MYTFVYKALQETAEDVGETRVSGVFIVFRKKDCEIMKFRAIKENHLYSKAYARGKKFVGRFVVVYILPDLAAKRLARANPTKEKVNRIGITVTKKLGGAVIRSRAKRVIREGFRAAEKAYPIKKGFLIVLVARASVVGAKSYDLAKDMEKAFKTLEMRAQ